MTTPLTTAAAKRQAKTELPRHAADEDLCGCDLDFRDADHVADEDLPPATGGVEGDDQSPASGHAE